MDNKIAQNEELFALQSIYEEKDFIVEDFKPPCGRYVANVQLQHPFYLRCGHDEKEANESGTNCKSREEILIEYLPPLNLFFRFPKSYPSETCPAFLLSCNWLNIDQLSKLCTQLEHLWLEGNGEVVLFRWIQFLQEETLEFLGIENYLDITELSNCSLKTNFVDELVVDDMNDSALCLNDNVSDDMHNTSSDSETSTSNVSLKISNLPHEKVTKTKHSNIVLENIKPSISGGSGVKDKRAFLDLPNGRILSLLIKDYDKFKKQECFLNSWHTCEICYQDKKGLEFVKFRNCNHTYCTECLTSYFEIQIKEGNVHLLNCPEDKCESQADGTLVKQLVRSDLFDKYDALLLSRTLECMSDVAYCPRQMCQCPLVIDSAGRIGTCPACNFVFCPYCKMAYHGVAPCNFKSEEKQKICSDYIKGNAEEKEELEKRYGKRVLKSLVDNTLSEDWIKSFSKNCPHCSASIEKTDGCNKMTCFRCGSFFCWLCMSRLKMSNPYSHFNDRTSECYGLLLPEEYLDDEFVIEPGEFLNID